MIKTSIALVCLGAMVFLPCFVVQYTLSFIQNSSTKSKVDLLEDKTSVYPDLTVCHPFFFDKEKIKGRPIGVRTRILLIGF